MLIFCKSARRNVFSSCLKSQETIKHLQEELACIEEAQGVFRTFADWLNIAQINFSTVAINVDVVDRFAMERKMKKLEVRCASVLHDVQSSQTVQDMCINTHVCFRLFRLIWSRVTFT